MMLKRSTHETKAKKGLSSRLVRAGVASMLAVASAAGLATGCLDRKVVPAQPTTSNVFVDQIVQTAVDKIDLLFMIDNSVSMADKQDILRDAVPVLLGRLVQPICVDANGTPTGGNADQTTGACPAPNAPEFAPIGDIHIGIVSSSLGSHGGNGACNGQIAADTMAGITDYNDDKGELIGTARPNVTTWNNSGFLAWDPSGLKNVPAGTKDAATLNTDFTNMITAVGEHGCGYEASLEAWYRFLIDPEPPATVSRPTGSNVTVRAGTDATVLAQRAAFLRPDSLVAIIMLSDENDCSIQDSGVGWFVSSTSHMPKATAACATNPNDACCRSCAQNEASPPSGCMPLSQDPVCMGAAANSYNTWDTANDSLNLRCYNQKQRFGFDLLYPTSRYVNALTAQTLVLESDGKTVKTNPLYDPGTSGKAPRDPSLVFLAGLVGVPWQDISTPDSLTGAGLTYLNATQLLQQGRWTQLLGTPNEGTTTPPVPPTDPFMIESIPPRSGANPNLASATIQPATSNNPQANVINGHEQNIPQNDDLQFACTFLLGKSKACANNDSACDCSASATGDTSQVTAANSPLCQPPGGGPAGTTQYYAKAYPGARELTVLRDFKDNAIVASICPKNTTTTTTPQSDPNYGYNPAVGAIIDRLKEALKGKCLPRKIDTDPTTHLVECEVIEAQKAGQCGDCSQPGRSPAPDAIHDAVFNQLRQSGSCGDAMGQTPCDLTGFCMCQINQLQDADLTTCQNDQPTNNAGYCYIDGDDFPNSPALKNCPDNEKRLLHFEDAPDGSVKTPAQGAIAFIACLGANINDAGM